MRTIRTKIYKFEELNADAKQVAIEEIRNGYYQYNDFAEWVIDDCWLLNPTIDEVKNFDLEDGILIGNNRKNIYFSTDRNWFLDCAEAMEIKNEDNLYTWLGITEDLRDDLTYDIFTPTYKNSDTKIEFEWLTDKPMAQFNDILDSAEEKFNIHITNCLKNIQADIEYRFTDEAIIEDIEANDYEFLISGKQYK